MLSIIFSILGLAAIIIFSIQVYKTAVSTERNAAVWTVLTVGIGVAFQFVVPFILGLVIGVYYIFTSTDVEKSLPNIEGLFWITNILCLILSIIGMMLVSKHVSKVIDVPVGSRNTPPPPPIF